MAVSPLPIIASYSSPDAPIATCTYRALLALALKLDFMAVSHSPLDGGGECLCLVLAEFLRRHFFLHLDIKPWGHLTLHSADFVGASVATAAVVCTWVGAAVYAYYVTGDSAVEHTSRTQIASHASESFSSIVAVYTGLRQHAPHWPNK